MLWDTRTGAVGNTTNGSVTGLTAGVQYAYRLRAQNASGASVDSATTTVTTLTWGAIGLPASAAFTATYTSNPASQEVVITNRGQTAYHYTNEVSYGEGASGWLTLLPISGEVSREGAQVVTAQVASATLNVGTYLATNTVVSPDATNSPQTMMVTLTVNKAEPDDHVHVASDQITTNQVGLSATGGGSTNPVIFTANGGPAVISGGTNLTFTGTGTVSLVVSQAGDTNWNEAPDIDQYL